MTNPKSADSSTKALCLRALVCGFLLAAFAVAANGQNETSGSTPLALSPGAPAGSFPLSDFESVNLYNGHLSFRLPLLKMGGRGADGFNLTLNIDQSWTVTKRIVPGNPAQFSPIPNWKGLNPDDTYKNPYGIGMLTMRQGTSKQYSMRCGGYYLYNHALTRLTFTAPDGTEYELRDQATGGQPIPPPCGGPLSRGTVFVSADGSAVTFIADSNVYDAWDATSEPQTTPPSGYLMLRDGTRYRIEVGAIKWGRDRNGNQITYSSNVGSPYVLTSVTDQLNRQVTISYGTFPDTPYDDISYKGFGNASRTIRVTYSWLQNALRSGYSIQTYHDLFPELNNAAYVLSNQKVVSSVVLPDGRQYQFLYNSYGELARVVLPTGAAIEYDYAAGLTGTYASGVFLNSSDKHIYRRVVERRVYPNGGTGTAYETRMTYSRPETTSTNLGYVVSENFGTGGVPLGRQWHYFQGSPRASFLQEGIDYPGWRDGREFWTYIFDGDGTTVVRQIVQTFAQRAAVSWWQGNPDLAPPNDVRLVEKETTLLDSNQVIKQTYSYDQFNNITDTYDYDYGNGAAGGLLRRSHTDYLTTNPVNTIDYTDGTAFNSIHLRNLPIEQWISSDAEGTNRLSRTTYEYDNYVDTPEDPNHESLLDREGISGMCTNYTVNGGCSNTSPTAYLTRGNVTAVSRWLLPSGTKLTSYAQYDIAGNAVKNIDARGNATMLSFTDNFGASNGEALTHSQPSRLGAMHSFAFPTSVTNAIGHTSYTQYDYELGQAIEAQDANGIVYTCYFNDDLDRPTQVIAANNIPALRQQRSFIYDDDSEVNSVTVTSDLLSYDDNLLRGQTFFDRMGRTLEKRAYETASNFVSTQMVPFGVVQDSSTGIWKTTTSTSNPFRPQLGEEPKWTTSVRDALSRVVKVTLPDDSAVKITYLGNATTVEDQAGKQRKTLLDGLQRPKTIYEAPNDTTHYNFQTSYTYDALGNLRTTVQGAQTRTFNYDSLSRLTSSNNPESGTATFTYDNNGNLSTRIDSRGTTTTYAYDALNRITQRTYSGGTTVGTPQVNYTYDSTSVAYSKGHLTSVGSDENYFHYTGFDALGRILTCQQVTDGYVYPMSYVYDLAGNLTSEVYPTGRVITHSYDNVGRLAKVSGQQAGGTAKLYANSFSYSASGERERMRLGNGAWEHVTVNSRLQPTEIGLGKSSVDSSLLKLNYDYGTTQNNGNVKRQVITVPTISTSTGFTVTQHYQYDPLNRLLDSQEVSGDSASWQSSGYLWQQRFTFDQYGNRQVDTGNTTAAFIGPNPSIDPLNNRISPRTGESYEYDAVGNLTKGQGGETLTYNAENKLVQYAGGASQIGGADYVYDGEGRRIKKVRPSETTIFVYNYSGRLVAEYSSATPQNNGTSYLTTDAIGTPRIITRADGSVRARHDYLPFGEELFANTGGRTTGQGYDLSYAPADNTRQKFTGKQRDVESKLDYFGERYYASHHGRFTSADPLGGSAKRAAPQSLNRYTYVLNNPLRFVDPYGLDSYDQLTKKEKAALVGKLDNQKGESDRAAFNRLVAGNNAKETQANIKSVKVFIAQAGGLTNSAVWQNIQTIKSVDFNMGPDPDSNQQQSSTIGIQIAEGKKDDFLKALKNEGYYVNGFGEEIRKAKDMVTTTNVLGAITSMVLGIDIPIIPPPHAYDNARARTDRESDPQLHFYNESGSNFFNVHWDRTSSNATEDGIIGNICGGADHGAFASPERINEYLKRTNNHPK
jgi:RHS repeat-associated protein